MGDNVICFCCPAHLPEGHACTVGIGSLGEREVAGIIRCSKMVIK